MKKTNYSKQVKVLGNISPNGKRQWGIVVSGGGIASTEVASQHKWPMCVIRKVK